MFKRIKNQVKWFIQRRTRGFDDRELWDLDDTVAKFIIPRLEAFRDMERMSYPDLEASFPVISARYNPPGEDLVVWFAMIDKMIQSFRMFQEYDFFDGNEYRSKLDESKVQYAKEGLELFSEYLHNLWD
jgi:hypothetical protein